MIKVERGFSELHSSLLLEAKEPKVDLQKPLKYPMKNIDQHFIPQPPSMCRYISKAAASRSSYQKCASNDIELVKIGMQSEFIPLELETRAVINTAAAAHHLNRQPQTLRVWACHDDGPIRPLRIKGRLAWPVSELRLMLGGIPLEKRGQHSACNLIKTF